jgi:hypothetical protein
MLRDMRKAITLTLSVALLGIFAAVVVAAMEPSDGTSTLPASSTGTTEDRTATAPDTAVQAPPPAPAPAPSAGVDIPGSCDEAEHANDPRCTGVGAADDAGRVDNSGPGSVNSGDDDFDDHGFDDHGDDDSSGSGHGGGGNSGPGGGDD